MTSRPGLPAFIQGYGPVVPWTADPIILPPRNPPRPEVTCRTAPDLRTALERANLRDGAVVSFHHHLRNGDALMARALQLCADMGLRDLHIAPSSIFPCHAPLVSLIERGVVTRITTSYMSGAVADAVSTGLLTYPAVLQTHGGRAAAIEDGRLVIDLALIAAPAIDTDANVTGAVGRSACGPLGYPMVDAAHARHVIAVTDEALMKLPRVCIPGTRINQMVRIDSLGDARQIASGTTGRSPDSTGNKIADLTAQVVATAFQTDPDFSFQTGAGAISLAAARFLAPRMHDLHIRGQFACGGITATLVDMYKAGLFSELKDVQAFDPISAQSYAQDASHLGISASEYASPARSDAVSDQLACVVLGAAEVDRTFNVNVTTTSDGQIIGGSGGHSDVAQGARMTVVTTGRMARNGPKIVNKVRHVTTPGHSVDILITEDGVTLASPRWQHLKRQLQRAGVPLLSPEALFQGTKTGTSGQLEAKIVAISEYRDGRVIDVIRAG